MSLIESLMLASILVVAIITSISDIRRSIISNRVLLLFAVISLILNIVYYVKGFGTLKMYFINLWIVATISLALYTFDMWAAGDSKLLAVIISLIPQNINDAYYNFGISPALLIIVVAFSIAFIYIIFESLVLRLENHEKLVIAFSKNQAFSFLKNYITSVLYLSAFNYLLMFLFKDFLRANPSILLFVDLILSCLVFKFKILFTKTAVCIVTVMLLFIIALSYATKKQLLLPQTRMFFYLIGIMCLSSLSDKYNYKVINTSDIRAGMILSFAAVIEMEASRIKGLPTETTEDMRSRLTEEEAENIRRWGSSRYGKRNVMIVKKIPFAIFISAGTACYIIGGILLC